MISSVDQLIVPSEEDPAYDEYRMLTTRPHEWLVTYRFRFPEGRAGHETGRMER